jgi:hypothetical protein
MGMDDIYATTFTEEKGWHVIEESAILEDEDGEEYSYWEEMFSLGFLQGLREDDPDAFALQYQNTIPENELGIIDPSVWVEGCVKSADEYEVLGIGMDLSASKREQSDYTVFTLVGVKDGQYDLLDLRRGKWSGNIDKCNALLPLLLDHGIIDTDTNYIIDNTGRLSWVVDEDSGEKPIVKMSNLYVNLFVEGQSYQISFHDVNHIIFGRIYHMRYYNT